MSPSFFELKKPRIIESATLFEESLIKIQRDKLEIEGRPPHHYYTLVTPPLAVAVIATTPNHQLILNREYRHPTKKFILGCPGGFLEPGEHPLEAAARELSEETGFRANSLYLMGEAFPYAGFSNQKTIFVRAYDAIDEGRSKLDPSEVIQPCLFSPQELDKALEDGADLDAILCAALFFKHRYEAFLSPKNI